MSTSSPLASTPQASTTAPAPTSSFESASGNDASHDGPLNEKNVKMAEGHPRTSESTTEGVLQRPSRRGTRETTASFEPAPLKKRLTDLFVPERQIKHEPSMVSSLKAIVLASWLNVLLVFVPIGWGLHWGGVNDTIVFVTTFLAIIPLAKLLGTGTEEIALRVGQTLGGLLNATLGNAVELIVAIIALVKCEIQVVQSSLLGSVLSNILLVLGMCFFAGGIKYSEQGFKDTAAQLNSSLLVISVIAILIPAGYSAAFSSTQDAEVEKAAILSMSRGIAIILLVIYGAYLIFQLSTHKHLYAEGQVEETEVMREGRRVYGLGDRRVMRPAKSVRKPRALEEDGDDKEEEEETPLLSLWAALILLAVVTVLVAITAEFLVSSINGLTDAHPQISKEWVGLILLPLVGNAAEHVTAVSVSVHDKLDLSMGVAVGSSIQIALFVVPFMVTLGWILNKPLSLLFNPFESIVLFLSVLITNYTIQDGRSNWLEGFLLMCVYVIIAVAFWYFPSEGVVESSLFVC